MQVADDPQLLDLMVKDAESAPDIYKTTHCWILPEKAIFRELQQLGLHDFRRRNNSALERISPIDLVPEVGHIDLFKTRLLNNRITRKIPFWGKCLSLQSLILNKILPVSNSYDVDDIRRLSYDFVRLHGEKRGAKPISQIEDSLAGNPEDVFEIEAKPYTTQILYYYLRYAYCCKHIDFDKVDTLVELGSGFGRQVEVIKKAHPDICFLLFDLPLPLYICDRYLSTVFPDSVVSYRETRCMESVPDIRKGKIFIFGTWKFPILDTTKIDLFWNARSLQQMEPDVIANYLGYVNSRAKNAFLKENMRGGDLAKRRGEYGVLKQTKLEGYKKMLSNFSLADVSEPVMPIGKTPPGYRDSFWKRL